VTNQNQKDTNDPARIGSSSVVRAQFIKVSTDIADREIFNLIDYIELVDWTGRIIRDDKRGAIGASTLN